jgi:hypothetical protein
MTCLTGEAIGGSKGKGPAPSGGMPAETGAGPCHERNEALTDYHAMTPEERFAAVDRMATELYGTARWKAAFARRYDLTTQGVGKWKHAGAPIWACVAIQDALDADRLKRIRETLAEAND